MDDHIVKIEDDFEIIDCDEDFLMDSCEVSTEVLPETSKQSYLKAYSQFEKWKYKRNVTHVTEDILMEYFKELSIKNKPTSLWAYYSMLKATLKIKMNLDIAAFRQLIGFLKHNSSGYEPSKAKAFSEADLQKFLFEAPDSEWLDVKVVFIFAACGGMRSYELSKIKASDVTSHGDSLFLVRIPKTKDRSTRSFTIADKYYTVVRKYVNLRSPDTVDSRFFVNYRNGKCTCQVIGRNKLNSMPRRIATYLQLKDPQSYSGHSFKRTLDTSTKQRNRSRHSTQVADDHYEKVKAEEIAPTTPTVITASNSAVQTWHSSNQLATVDHTLQEPADMDVFEISLLGDSNENGTRNASSTTVFDSFNNNNLPERPNQTETKMRYIDPIHGVIELPNIIFQIINTEFFQRLRNLKQLGASSYVFPGTTHTRFEHSIGVCHLIDKFLSIIEKNSNIKVDEFHRKCVMVAGLLHDVGHGPFSHMWDQFVHQRRHKYWSHEDSSCEITRHIFAKNDIKLSSNFHEHSNGIELIVGMIIGNLDCLKKYLTKEQMYLSEIVNNKFCFIDVDKWDYILRDSYYLNNVISIPTGFERVFAGARVTKTPDGVTHISYHIDDYHLVHELFENRANLHGRCYQHPEIIGIEHLLVKAFLSAEDSGFVFQGVKLSEAHMHPEVYQYLDDSIIQIITICNDTRLKEAQAYLKRVRTRNLYPIVGMSSRGFEVPSRNGLTGQFIMKERNVPTAIGTMPVNLILHDDNGEICQKPSELHPKYILYYTKQVNPAVLLEAKMLQK